ncbi:arylsulfatase [Seonamhaeicola maritimus]|uniref:arylsulfatase n=1 Tax=Seonamhaeicola maritimus TaxID=2591822 RepID=UPI002493E3E7|nr:arylsulfatase [Seonamhaeicola maritimus]
MKNKYLILLIVLGLNNLMIAQVKVRPNVILILTDDQGIGDLSCYGNPWLKTPNLDAFYEESVRMTDFHVSPLCTPTRAAIMTGRYPINNGAWATFKGRDALSKNAITMADVFKQNGYKTGLFGKWHLGDNYPARPTDFGFDTAIHHLAGGVGELSDYWGNSYFDDVYYVNNEPKQFKGYCTDVWFDETMKFIDENEDEPFFVYLPTNAPHDPLIVDEKYAKPYRHLEGNKIIDANLYGMIANIDENFGEFYKFLENKKLLQNTILIFMSDNGTRFGYSPDGKLGYNKGFEGIKGSKLEGGHIVPFFIRWPNGNIQGGKDVHNLAAHVDLLPTLATMCNLNIPRKAKLDGIDFSPVLTHVNANLSERSVFVHHRQDWRQPEPITGSCIMKDQWRLINGSQLYDIVDDPKQKNNLVDDYPELVKELLEDNSKFIKESKKNQEYHELPMHVIGNEAQNEIKLTIQHAIGEDGGIWKPEQVAAGMKNTNNTHALKVEKSGDYLISCMRWPKECSGPILGVPKKNPKDLYEYKTISPNKVRISIANQIIEKDIQSNEEAVTFKVNLKKGKTLLVTDFLEGKKKYGVYYTYVECLEINK